MFNPSKNVSKCGFNGLFYSSHSLSGWKLCKMAGFEPSKNLFFATSEKSMSGGYGSNLGYQRSHQMIIFSTTIPSGATRCLGSTLVSWWCNFTILKNIKIVNGNNWVSDDIIWHPIDQKSLKPPTRTKPPASPASPASPPVGWVPDLRFSGASIHLGVPWRRDAVTPWRRAVISRSSMWTFLAEKCEHPNLKRCACRLFIDKRSFSLYI